MRKKVWLSGAAALAVIAGLALATRLGTPRPPSAEPENDPAPTPAWLAAGLARHAQDPAGLAALDLLGPIGPVSLDRLAGLGPGALEDPAYEQAVATAQLLATYLAGGEVQTVLAHPPAALESDFRSWLGAYTPGPAPLIPPDPTPWIGSYSHPAPKVRTQYRLDLEIVPQSFTLKAQQQVRFTNNESVSLGALYFHLFPNAPQFTQGQRPGGLTVTSVRVNDQPATFHGADAEILGVALPAPLEPGAAVTVDLTWSATVPDDENRYGVEGETILLGNFYPILAVHDQGGWHLDRYVDAGDPFYSEVADYDVRFTVPTGYQIVATGHPDETGRHYTAQQVRDFGAAVSRSFQVSERTVDGVRIRYAWTPGRSYTAPGDALTIAAEALRFYNEHFGAYPYPDLTIVAAGLGMEYPQFVMAGSPAAIAHEIAHQWWYGLVGNDELRQIWDEGLTEYSSMWYLQEAGRSSRPVASADATLTRTLYEYAGQPDRAGQYGPTIYGRGWRLWQSLHSLMGDADFTAMLRNVAAQHQFGIATWADWREAVGAAGGQEALALFDRYLSGGHLQ